MENEDMRTRKYRLILLGVLTAAAIAAGWATQVSGGAGLDIAGLKGEETFGRESSIAGSKAEEYFGRESS